MGDFKEWGDPSKGGDDFEMGCGEGGGGGGGGVETPLLTMIGYQKFWNGRKGMLSEQHT